MGSRATGHQLPRRSSITRAIATASSSSASSSASNFNPEVGFVRRDDMRRSFGQFRFSPRPRAIRSVASCSWTASMAYIENGAGRLETRDCGRASSPSSSRTAIGSTSATRGIYEFLPEPFRHRAGRHPAGRGLRLRQRDGRVQLRPAAERVRRMFRASTARSTTATRRRSASARAGVNLTPQLSVEPTVSVNWVDLVEGSFTTQLVGSRVTYTMTPLMFVSALLQYNSGEQRWWPPTCACAGNIGRAASCSSCSTSSGTRSRGVSGLWRTAR